MPLSIGQRVKAELSGAELHVLKKLGEGTQGEVYLVERTGRVPGSQMVQARTGNTGTAERDPLPGPDRPAIRCCRETVCLASPSRYHGNVRPVRVPDAAD